MLEKNWEDIKESIVNLEGMGKRIREVEDRLKDKEKNKERAERKKVEGVEIRKGEDSS